MSIPSGSEDAVLAVSSHNSSHGAVKTDDTLAAAAAAAAADDSQHRWLSITRCVCLLMERDFIEITVSLSK